MVKKVKGFIGFILFSIFYFLLSGRVYKKHTIDTFGISDAFANTCCPPEASGVDENGACEYN